MNKQIDAEKLINILVGKIAELELENAKLKVLIDTKDNMLAEQKEGKMECNLMGITSIVDVCKQKLRETVGQMLFINDNKLYLLIRKKETNGKKY